MNDIVNMDTIIGMPRSDHFIHGNGKTITVQVTLNPNPLYRSLFPGGTINNLNVDGYIINGRSAIASGGIISYCTNNVNNLTHAGIVSHSGIILHCVNNGTTFGAGIVAEHAGTVSFCINTGQIISTTNNTGGIAASSLNGFVSIDNCINIGSVEGTNNVGGMIGEMRRGQLSAIITNNINYATIKRH